MQSARRQKRRTGFWIKNLGVLKSGFGCLEIVL
jgi:hypothetical protein